MAKFRKRDLARAASAFFDAGANEVQAEISDTGSMVVTGKKKDATVGSVTDTDTDDKELASFRRKNGY